VLVSRVARRHDSSGEQSGLVNPVFILNHFYLTIGCQVWIYEGVPNLKDWSLEGIKSVNVEHQNIVFLSGS